jgi:hypothetical protein
MAIREIAQQFAKQFVAYGQLCSLADRLLERNLGKFGVDRDRPSTQVVAALYAKARKTADAVCLLAQNGYGEDATILARA